MLDLKDVSSLVMALVGAAFLLIWSGDRANRSALDWGLSHLALALAAFAGYRYQAGGGPLVALGALAGTGLFIALMWSANRALEGRPVTWRRVGIATVSVSACLGVLGFGLDQWLGRLVTGALMSTFYLWSGLRFLRLPALRGVGSAFILKAATFALVLMEGRVMYSIDQSDVSTITSITSSLILAGALIHQAAQLSRKRLLLAIHHLPEALVATTPDDEVIFCNAAYARWAGEDSPEHLEGHPAPLKAPKGDDDNQTREWTLETAQGPVPVETARMRFNDFGLPVDLMRFRDLREQRASEETRIRLLTTDPLTGLPNRMRFTHLVSGLLTLCSPGEGQCIPVASVDVDQLKRLGQALGWGRADELIRSIAERLAPLIEQGAIVAYGGGGHFLATRMPCTESDARTCGEDLARQLIGAIERQIDANEIVARVGATAGITLGRPGEAAAAVILRAEQAMREAKSKARGTIRWFDDGMLEQDRQRLVLETSLREALAKGGFELHFQPVIAISNGRIAKAEALMRWRHPTMGWVPPSLFIPIAEQAGLIVALGHWVMEEALRQAATWQEAGVPTPRVAINVSVLQFLHPGFSQHLNETAARFGVPPSAIELELTESVMANDADGQLASLLASLRRQGFGLSLDDFGTGYASLGYLSRFEISTLKIDRSFIEGIDVDPRRRSLLRAAIAMGHGLGLEVVAEGIETNPQRVVVIEEGIDFIQGYLTGRPMPAKDFAALLRRQSPSSESAIPSP